MASTKRVLIGAGHRHTLGESGNPFEADLNGRKVRTILDAYDTAGGAARFGFELRTYTPDRGLGLFPGYLNQAPVSGFTPDWTPDLMIELHSEGVGNPGVRGAFCIYPDAARDVDTDARDVGKVFAIRLNAAAKGQIAVRTVNGYGMMSERSTGVGLQGYRLGVFRDTARFNVTTTRMIFEQGAHSHPGERAYMQSAAFLPVQATAFLEAIGEFYDAVDPDWTQAEPPAAGYATPAPVPWKLGSDLGWQVLNGIEVYCFNGVATARKGVVPRAWASGSAPATGKTIPAGTRAAIRGKFETPNRVGWLLLEDGSRARESSFDTHLEITERDEHEHVH